MKNVQKDNCVVCRGLVTAKDLAGTPIRALNGHEPVCVEHIEDVIKEVYVNE